MNLRWTLCIFAMLFSISACGGTDVGVFRSTTQNDGNILTPTKMFTRGLPRGNDSYSQGIRDGCETFLGIVGAGALRMLPTTLDGYRLSEDRMYARGYVDGANHCTHSLDWDTH